MAANVEQMLRMPPIGHCSPFTDEGERGINRRSWVEADRMDRRIYDGLTPKVAEAFGHQRSGTEELERRLRGAVAGKDWERVRRLGGQPTKQGRQGG